ncbi:MAG: hypothetical protein COW10_00160 [Candidatus Omnitrophica bacterium CG12_big_fil_rev_8_21_14_0_65_42_8]|nr:MAG: hypothetical protein COW10_00160 [Candidatus Omnitrophica bacterium CG12_big_fil_rev_8_21_14_0_65_42_8]
MIQFIFDNKEWIFSGIGVVVILSIIRFFLNQKKRHQSIKAGDYSTNIQTGDASTVTISANNQNKDSLIHTKKPVKIDDRGCVTHTTYIQEGAFQEFIWGDIPVKITISEIVKKRFYFSRLRGEKEARGAVINVSIDGRLVHGGADCKETDVNQYLVPQNILDEEELCSVYSYHISKNYFRFFRVLIDHVNPHNHQVTLNIFFANINDVKST